VSDLPADISLADARLWLMGRMDKGAECPCCRQYAKIYRRKLTSSMAYALILICRYYRNVHDPHSLSEWLHVPEWLSKTSQFGATVRGGDWAKLVYWELIEPKTGSEREDGSERVGYYRLTEMGLRFVKGEVRVPRVALVYNQSLLRMDDTVKVDIREALTEKFDYGELMGWQGPAAAGGG
jgi:hypothetical protein